MAFCFLPAEAESLARAIYKFQGNINNKKASYINFNLQKLVNCVAANKLINLPLFNVSKRKIRVAISASSCFYDSFWLTDKDKFLGVVAYFNKITANFQIIDFFFQQSIPSVVTSVVAIAMVVI